MSRPGRVAVKQSAAIEGLETRMMLSAVHSEVAVGQFDLPLAVADVNGDARADLVYWRGDVSLGDAITVRYQRADGTYTWYRPLAELPGEPVVAAAAGKFTSGNGIDIAVISQDRRRTTIRLLVQQADGTYVVGPPTRLPVPLQDQGVEAAAARLNGPGTREWLIVFNRALKFNNAGRTIATQQLTGSSYRNAAISVIDIDHDGDDDLSVDGQVLISLRWRRFEQVHMPSDVSSSLRLGDVNGDGVVDLAWISGLEVRYSSGRWEDQLLSFAESTLVQNLFRDEDYAVTIQRARLLALGDGHGDGRADIVVEYASEVTATSHDRSRNDLHRYHLRADDTWEDAQDGTPLSDDHIRWVFAAMDFDGNGLLDSWKYGRIIWSIPEGSNQRPTIASATVTARDDRGRVTFRGYGLRDSDGLVRAMGVVRDFNHNGILDPSEENGLYMMSWDRAARHWEVTTSPGFPNGDVFVRALDSREFWSDPILVHVPDA